MVPSGTDSEPNATTLPNNKRSIFSQRARWSPKNRLLVFMIHPQ
jgi:hypothetical protein